MFKSNAACRASQAGSSCRRASMPKRLGRRPRACCTWYLACCIRARCVPCAMLSKRRMVPRTLRPWVNALTACMPQSGWAIRRSASASALPNAAHSDGKWMPSHRPTCNRNRGEVSWLHCLVYSPGAEPSSHGRFNIDKSRAGVGDHSSERSPLSQQKSPHGWRRSALWSVQCLPMGFLSRVRLG